MCSLGLGHLRGQHRSRRDYSTVTTEYIAFSYWPSDEGHRKVPEAALTPLNGLTQKACVEARLSFSRFPRTEPTMVPNLWNLGVATSSLFPRFLARTLFVVVVRDSLCEFYANVRGEHTKLRELLAPTWDSHRPAELNNIQARCYQETPVLQY